MGWACGIVQRNLESSSASALERMVSMTGYLNTYKLDIPMQWRWRWRWWAASGSHHRCRRVRTRLILWLRIADFTEITVSNSDNDLHLVRVTSVRLDSQMPDIPEVEIWRTVSLWMFLLSLLSSCLYFFTSLDLGPVQMASARVFTASGDKSSGGGVSPCAGSAEWLPYGNNRLWDLWVRTFAYVERLFDCFLSIPTLVRVYAAQGVCT